MFSVKSIAIKYFIFAQLAMLANFGMQEATGQIYDGKHALGISLVVGTLTGLIVKYHLDKKYIFGFDASNLKQETRVFFLYAVVGLVTTLVFWGFELGFWHLFGTWQMRYVGGALGLFLGYAAKYQLDKRYVFPKGCP